MDAGVDRPLVLNFGHPLNQICRQQLDEELPGWEEWRSRSPYRVDDSSDPVPEIRHWFQELESEQPGWSQRTALYYIAHSFATVNTALVDMLKEACSRCPIEISRDRAPRSPVEIFIVYRVGRRMIDARTSLAHVTPIPGFLVDLGTVPLTEEQQEQVRSHMPRWLRLQHIHTPVPEAAAGLEAAEIDRLIVGMATDHQIMPEEHPCVLAWFRQGGHPNDVVRFIARFHGVTGYFPSMVKFDLKRAYRGAVNPNVLGNLSCWDVAEVESYGELRAQGAALRAGFSHSSERSSLEPVGDCPAVLPSAVALVAFQWSRWAHNHTLDTRQWPTLLTRLDGTLQPGSRSPACAGVDEDIIRALKALQRPAELAVEGPDAGVLFDAIRAYVGNVGRRYDSCITDLARVGARFEERIPEWGRWSECVFGIEVSVEDLPARRVAVRPEALEHCAIVPLIQNAARAGARRVAVSSRVHGTGDDEAWLIEVKNDGRAFDDLGHLDQEGGVHGGIGSLLSFADEHLATLRVHSRAGEGAWQTREWTAGAWRWNETRNGLIPVGSGPRGWGPVGPLPRRSHPPDPFRVCWELAIPLAILGE